jgi:hypothetical protein
MESAGTLRDGRWAPLRASSRFEVRGRTNRSDILYDWGGRLIDYHDRGETFFLRRQRVVDDLVAIPPAQHVDDVISAILNYADGSGQPPRTVASTPPSCVGGGASGKARTTSRRSTEPSSCPSCSRRTATRLTGKAAARFDMTRFSSWATPDRPGEIVFGPDRRLESIVSSLILGTSVAIRITSG